MALPNSSTTYQVVLLPGDGIGPEIADACRSMLEQVHRTVRGFTLNIDERSAGAGLYRDTGEALPAATMAAIEKADAVLLAAMGLPEVRLPDGREIVPQLDLRDRLDLYAGMRPLRSLPGVPGALADERADSLDILVIRESTEGMFARRDGTEFAADGSSATDTMVITRRGAERVFVKAFEAATLRRERGGKGRVTCVDKANVLGSLAFFRSVFWEVAASYPDIDADCCYVDAIALELVRRPWEYDVLVTENIFGDILSDLGAGLIGGLGMAPSGDVGDDAAVFQPCHGTAPDIVGTGAANPTAMFLSAAMMLEWLGERHDDDNLRQAGTTIVSSVDRAFESGDLRSTDFGGPDGTEQITDAVLAAIVRS